MSYHDKLEDIIEEHGWAIQGVFPTEENPGYHFQYTVGLHDKGLPELVVYGLPHETGGSLLNFAADKTIQNGEITVNEPASGLLVGDLTLFPVDVTDDNECFQAAYRHEGEQVRVTQLIWPDAKGLFPWEDGAVYNFTQNIPEKLLDEKRGGQNVVLRATTEGGTDTELSP